MNLEPAFIIAILTALGSSAIVQVIANRILHKRKYDAEVDVSAVDIADKVAALVAKDNERLRGELQETRDSLDQMKATLQGLEWWARLSYRELIKTNPEHPTPPVAGFNGKVS